MDKVRGDIGSVFDIQRWSLQDGKGIRTTVFLNGCPLRCKWCHNPESWNKKPVLAYDKNNCYTCGHCIEVCSVGANTVKDGKLRFQKDVCTLCGECTDVCSENVREVLGEEMSVTKLIDTIKRDAIFYRESGGGVTFSGGEPTFQHEFLRNAVKSCSENGINTAIETCGYFNWEEVNDIFEMLDFVYFDIKHMDNETHKKLTGVGNEIILENARNISKLNKKIVVRIPLIAEVNDCLKNIEDTLDFINENMRIEGIEFLKYHTFGDNKYKTLGLESCDEFKCPSDERIKEVSELVLSKGLRIIS